MNSNRLIFTDGSYYPDSKIGGFGLVVCEDRSGDPNYLNPIEIIREGPKEDVSALEMEIDSLSKALEHCQKTSIDNFRIVTDSKFAMKKLLIFKEMSHHKTYEEGRELVKILTQDLKKDFKIMNNCNLSLNIPKISKRRRRKICKRYLNLAKVVGQTKQLKYDIVHVKSHSKDLDVKAKYIIGNSYADFAAKESIKNLNKYGKSCIHMNLKNNIWT